MRKERVHNEFEAKALIREAFKKGTEDKYNGCKFWTHDEEFLFICTIETNGFVMNFDEEIVEGQIPDTSPLYLTV